MSINDVIFASAKIAANLLSFEFLLFFLAFLTVGAVFFRRWTLAKTAGVLQIFLWLLVSFTPIPYYFLRQIENQASLLAQQKAPDLANLDYLIVLGGGVAGGGYVHADRGDIALGEASERITKALELAKRYPHLRLVLTGDSTALLKRNSPKISDQVSSDHVSEKKSIAPSLASESPETEADLSAAFLVEQGIDRQRIVIENRSRNTRENAQNIAIWLESLRSTSSKSLPSKLPSYAIITSASHMPRATQTFQKAGLNPALIAVDFWTDQRDWRWQDIDFSLFGGLKAWRIICHEQLGRWWYAWQSF